uniref:Ras guanyl-releasing protein 3 n=1 Tax=Parascaris univalens TaxID=6257 RepID=A0A915C0V3_PARUN
MLMDDSHASRNDIESILLAPLLGAFMRAFAYDDFIYEVFCCGIAFVPKRSIIALLPIYVHLTASLTLPPVNINAFRNSFRPRCFLYFVLVRNTVGTLKRSVVSRDTL